MIDARVLSGIIIYHRKPTYLGKPFEGSFHRKTAYNPSLEPCYFPSRADCSLSRKISLVVADFLYLWALNEFQYLPSDATTLLT